MGLQNLFWVSGDDNVDNKASTDKVSTPQPNQTHTPTQQSTSLIEKHNDLLQDELKFFESQMELFDSTSTNDQQLIAIAMVTVTQKFPNISCNHLISMYKDNKTLLSQLQKEIVDNNNRVIDNKSHVVRTDYDAVVEEISVCERTLCQLHERERELQEQTNEFATHKTEFSQRLNEERSGLLQHTNTIISMLSKHSEDT